MCVPVRARAMAADLGINDASSDTTTDDASREREHEPAPPPNVAGAAAKERARAEREERRRVAMALPRPRGRRGGAHESSAPWTLDEKEALLRLRALEAVDKPSWALIARDLAQSTGRPRSATSVRQLWMRMRNGRARAQLPRGDATRAKNFCARCGALKLGHLCTSAPSDEMLTEQARRAIEEGALESDEEW